MTTGILSKVLVYKYVTAKFKKDKTMIFLKLMFQPNKKPK